ncbi:hypothetical protein GCM10008908_08650 [Clostridium subterminale]|uniref:Uncharacterized protein n=1 Tax=Clostridium subterminale TaxID=1550 RepID=A0ABP3VWZ6_CLOSU
MAFDNEYEFVPLAPMTHNSLPDEMKDFISVCGMMGVMPRNNFIHPMQKELAEIIDLKETHEDIDIPTEAYFDEDFEDDVERYVEENGNRLLKDFGDENDFKLRQASSKEENNDELMRIEKVIKSIERNNLGVFKFLEVNGMPYEKAKKFIRRIIRLSIRYAE